MNILGIDTSFDDTAAAVVSNTRILSSVLSSQLPMFQKWGGVVPRLARESHERNIDRVIESALKRASLTWEGIDAVAVTQGPGLAITLEIGLAKAKQLTAIHDKKLLAINHLEGHLLSVLARPRNAISPIDLAAIFPAMGVIVSGGTTQFVLAAKVGEYGIVGQTQDDALGEAFDKVGRMLGLGYPAGAMVEKLAKEGSPGKIIFPVPMRSVKSADTSFSGLKTAASRLITNLKETRQETLTKQDICDVALAFQTAAIRHLTEKLDFALHHASPKSLILGGGVASNNELRIQLRSLAKTHNLPMYFPYSKKLCVDNAAMIAIAGYFHALQGKYVGELTGLDRLPNARLGWPLPQRSN